MPLLYYCKLRVLKLDKSFYQKNDNDTKEFLKIIRLTIMDKASIARLKYIMDKRSWEN